jgi:hypothetical protein
MTKRKRQTTQWPKEKDRQHNSQKKKRTNTDLHNTTFKNKDRAKRTILFKKKNTDR